MKTEEIKLDMCYKHKESLQDVYPSYVFNSYLSFPARECRVPECHEEAFYSVIGIKVPDSIGREVTRENKYCAASYEIYREAKKIMDGAPAQRALTVYLKTRIIPSYHKEIIAEKILNHHSWCILHKLGIDPACSLSDKDKHAILRELDLYPEGDF